MKHLAATLILFAAFAMPAASQEPTSVTVKMSALNGSGEDGMATVTQVNGAIVVSVDLQNGTSIAQPTHIHIGTCGAINKAPEYALRDTVDGKGESTVPGVSLSDLLKGHYAINVHKSGTDLGTYVSCGNIR
ncbi:MAG TPA: hypothetical protein VMG98_00885 [Verrucomicrobiae bacterium]|nr:hypothetical protein [Verrucomicrobiae bacterium]